MVYPQTLQWYLKNDIKQNPLNIFDCLLYINMKRIFKSDKISIDITDENGQEILYNHLCSEYGVNKNQVWVDEDERIWLTNKVGEKFAMIGAINYS